MYDRSILLSSVNALANYLTHAILAFWQHRLFFDVHTQLHGVSPLLPSLHGVSPLLPSQDAPAGRLLFHKDVRSYKQTIGRYVCRCTHTHTHTHTHAQTHTRTHTPLKESTHTTPPDHSSCPSPRYYEDVRRLPPVMPQQMKAHLARLSQSYNHELLMSGQGVNMDRVLYSLFGCVSKYSDEVWSNTHTHTRMHT